VVADLVLDPSAPVVGDAVPGVPRVDVAAVGPEAGSPVVVHPVVQDSHPGGPPHLAAARLPAGRVAGGAVVGDLVVPEQGTGSPGPEAELALVVDVVPDHGAPSAEADADAVVASHLVLP